MYVDVCVRVRVRRYALDHVYTHVLRAHMDVHVHIYTHVFDHARDGCHLSAMHSTIPERARNKFMSSVACSEFGSFLLLLLLGRCDLDRL